MRRLIASALLLAAFAACAQTEDTTTPEATSTEPAATATASASTATAATVKTESNMKFGTILVDGEGRSLYTFDKDTGSTSACTGQCATTWPPVLSSTTPSGVEGLSLITRPDSGQQVAYKGKPLYRYAGDSKPGDTNGDGVGGIWHIAKVT